MAHKRWVLHGLPLLCGCLALMAHALARSQEFLALESFTERLSKDIPVSGRMLVGAVGVLPGERKAPVSLTPRLLWRGVDKEKPTEPLCVTFASRDGQYYGEGTLSSARMQILPNPPPPLKGAHKTDAEKYLSKRSTDDLAMLASTGDCRLGSAGATTTTIHVLNNRVAGAPAHQASASGEFTLLLMLNSMTYTLEVDVVLSGNSQKASCQALDDAERNKAFNTVCELTVPNSATVADLVIKRRRYERGFEPLRFKLAWSPLLP